MHQKYLISYTSTLKSKSKSDLFNWILDNLAVYCLLSNLGWLLNFFLSIPEGLDSDIRFRQNTLFNPSIRAIFNFNFSIRKFSWRSWPLSSQWNREPQIQRWERIQSKVPLSLQRPPQYLPVLLSCPEITAGDTNWVSSVILPWRFCRTLKSQSRFWQIPV